MTLKKQFYTEMVPKMTYVLVMYAVNWDPY